MPRSTAPDGTARPDIGWDTPQRHTPSALERRGVVARPYPPEDCADDCPECFVPDATFAEWIRDTFVAATGPLANEDHAHLLDARLGVVWTNAIYRRQMRHVLATAEIPQATAGGWKRARHDYQLREWFDVEPHFLLTFSAPDCLHLDDRAFCALVEHELYHCGQAEDAFGSPKFNSRTGEPIFAIRGHDSEEFVGIVRRYGLGAVSQGTRDLVAAAHMTPDVSPVTVELACGTCNRRVA
jgi:hypothetical protein